VLKLHLLTKLHENERQSTISSNENQELAMKQKMEVEMYQNSYYMIIVLILLGTAMAQTLLHDDILRSTLSHIQMKRCQYIDNFPEAVTDIIESVWDGKKLKPYDLVKQKFYRISTSFFDINADKVKKRDFFIGLYGRIGRKVAMNRPAL
jgi:hypothetical protein